MNNQKLKSKPPDSEQRSGKGLSVQRLVRVLVRKWDWWIYGQAYRSLKRMVKDTPGFAYLLELHLRGWNERHPIPDDLRNATERFYEAMERCSPNAKGEASPPEPR